MSFLSEVKSSTPKVGRTPYKMAEIEKSLNKKDFAEFQTALADPTISVGAIHKVLKTRGIDVSTLWLRNVRNGKVQ